MAQTPRQPILNQTSPQKITSSQKKGHSKLESRLEKISISNISKLPSTKQSIEKDQLQNLALEATNWHQPTSKSFLSRFRLELQVLLDSIKDNYHNEIKSLYETRILTDLVVQIGDQFEASLHRCLIASRAFKLYSALKGFKLIDCPSIPNNIPSKPTEFSIEQGLLPEEREITLEDGNQESPGLESESRGEESEVIESHTKIRLPNDLLSPEYFTEFIRRTYLNQDLLEEETRLYRLIIDWVRLNKPELIKSNAKCSPDHKESFRTIQPDFDQSSIRSTGSPIMFKKDQCANMDETKARKNSICADSTSEADQIDDNYQINNPKDESLTSSLTRTETFEMIPRSNAESPNVSDRQAIDTIDSTDDESRRRSETGGDANESESSEPYAPTTRTGLKPKKFTTPVGLKSNKATRVKSLATSSGSRALDPNDSSSSGGHVSKFAGTGSIGKKVAENNSERANKHKSSISTSNDSQTKSTQGVTANKPKISSTLTGPSKAKLTIIARAHPISMERSQSPGMGLVKTGTTKNFIAANKRSVSQRDKTTKLANSTQNSNHGDTGAGNCDSETEYSDVSFLPIESLRTDELAAQLDSFSLVTYSRLAEALSRMFIDGILIDATIHVKDGKEIGAHKCILAARSPYLNDVINQHCLTSLSSDSHQVINNQASQPLKIDLGEFSHSAVYFSVLHIYSGIVKVPNDLDLDELAKLSYLLHVGTLKQVSIYNLRMLYCHCFHKPCNTCCLGVLKTLPLAWRYDYTELYSDCLQWIGANFANIFCLEEFSKLKPNDLIEECYNATLSQLTPDNVIQKTVECQRLLKSLPRVKWTESIICLVGRLLEDFCHYVSDNYEKVLQTESFMNLGKSCWGCEILEENLLAAMNHLKPDSGCKTLIQLDKIECSIETYCEEPKNVSESFANLISKMRKYCERYLLKEAASVVHCSSWRQMAPALQKRIKDQALLSTDFDEPTKHLANKPKLPAMKAQYQRSSPSPQLLKASGYNSGSESARSPSNPATPDSKFKATSSPATTYLPSPKTKQATSRQVKVLK